MSQKVDWRKAYLVESKVADIISRQEKRGVWFDQQRAKFYIHLLTERILKIDLVAVPQMPKILEVSCNVPKPFKKNGDISVACQKWLDQVDGVSPQSIGGPFTGIIWRPFDLGKTGLFKDWLIAQGWKPDTYNIKDITLNSKGERLTGSELSGALNKYMEGLVKDSTGPHRMQLLGIRRGRDTVKEVKDKLLKVRKLPTSAKITEESLETVETTLGALVRQRMVWSHRRSLLQGLVDQVRSDGRLPAGANPDATPTHRMRHRVVVNIPAARSPFGKEIRGLFGGGLCDSSLPASVIASSDELSDTVRIRPNTNMIEVLKKGQWKPTHKRRVYIRRGKYVFVGYDGAGLELRMLAHYINDPAFTKEVVEGDIHTKNQLAAELPTRDDAKTFIYAFIYGAGDGKLGLIIGGTSRDGAGIRAKFLAANPLLAALIERVKAEAEAGFLIGLDGRKLMMRKNEFGGVMVHKALNTLLQAAGAVVMKYAMVLLDEQVAASDLRAFKVVDMHDEGQWECHPEDVPKLRKLMDNCVRIAGETLGLNCPLASDSIIGATWADTH